MHLQFLGATGTVTGSKYLLRPDHGGDGAVLVDCGLFQGYKQLRLRNWAELPVAPRDIAAVVLTHAHIDHSGYLPLLVKQGFTGRIYCSAATRELCGILLPDCGGLQEEEADFNNRHHTSKHTPALPLYTREDAVRCLDQLEPVPWHADFRPVPWLTGRLSHAGHMPGGSVVRLHDGQRSIVFSGDLGRGNDPVLRAPDPLPACDYLVIESTYGDRLHPAGEPFEQLAEVIKRTAARGGTLVIPAFAVGRAQILLHGIRLLKQQKRIHHLPVYLNSPMASDALQVYQHHKPELRLSSADCDALSHAAEIVRSPDESRALNARKGPMIIIAGSGMATGGRVVHHLQAFAPDRRNTILLAGFQAGGTRGAALAAGASTIRIHGEDVPVRAEVAHINALSAHADAAEIEAWLRTAPSRPRQTFITHGEPDAADALRQRIERNLHWDVTVPEYLQDVALD